MNVGIIGNGYVGKATALMCENHNLKIYDKDKSKSQDCTLQELVDFSNLIFICVPTPMEKNGSCYTAIVESVVSELANLKADLNKLVIRSTVPVGTSEKLKCNFMPEFLTEKNWRQDVVNCKEWVFGVHDEERFDKSVLLELANDRQIHYCTTKEAEICKNIKNAFLATKVSFFNEVYELCDKLGVDYEQAKRLILLDERINASHTEVPGHDGKKGFGGTCFPKDIRSLLFQMHNVDMDSYILKAAINRNEIVDRPEKEWENNKGRSVV